MRSGDPLLSSLNFLLTLGDGTLCFVSSDGSFPINYTKWSNEIEGAVRIVRRQQLSIVQYAEVLP